MQLPLTDPDSLFEELLQDLPPEVSSLEWAKGNCMNTHTETVPSTVQPAPSPEPVHLVILHGISWGTYERVLAEHEESSGTRFTYDRGMLEIMVLSAKHEALKDVVTLLVNVLAEEKGIDVQSFGSTTFRRADLERGFEPDACFYIQNEERVSGKDELDLTRDPPPDLVLEIDLTHSSLNKFPIFAALGVLEVWRYDGERVSIFTLEAGAYVEAAASVALSGVTGEALDHLIVVSKQLKRTAWLRQVRDWAHHHGGGGNPVR